MLRVSAFIALFVSAVHAQTLERTICADPYPPPADRQPIAARLTLNGQPAGTCSIVQKASGAVPVCKASIPLSMGPIAIGMAVQGPDGQWSAETVKGYAVALKSCGAPDGPTSTILCVASFGPVPTEPFPSATCGDPAPVPQLGWTAVGGTIFRHANGKLTGVVSGKTAAKDSPCKGVTVSTAGTFIYQELVGGVAGEATRCTK